MVLTLALLCLARPLWSAQGTAPVRVELTAHEGARLVGDHETVTATVTNTGSTLVHEVILLLSLVDSTGTPAVPLGLEDWTPTPEAVRTTTLAPGAQLTGTWRLRMIQASHLAIFATAVTGSARSVTHSQPLVLRIGPTRNLTPATVLPVTLGGPLAVLGSVGTLCWRRRTVDRRPGTPSSALPCEGGDRCPMPSSPSSPA